MKVASNAYRAWSGVRDRRYDDLARGLNLIHGVTLLSTAGIVQPAQLSNVVARTSWTDTIKGLSAVLKDWSTGQGGFIEWAKTKIK